MSAPEIDIYNAFLQARYTAEALLTASSKENPHSVEFHMDAARKHFRRLAHAHAADGIR